MEVLSESTEAYDRGDKFAHYRHFDSLAEYMLIDPVKPKTEIFRRDTSGHWVLYEFGGDDTIDFVSLGLTLESQALYENV